MAESSVLQAQLQGSVPIFRSEKRERMLDWALRKGILQRSLLSKRFEGDEPSRISQILYPKTTPSVF